MPLTLENKKAIRETLRGEGLLVRGVQRILKNKYHSKLPHKQVGKNHGEISYKYLNIGDIIYLKRKEVMYPVMIINISEIELNNKVQVYFRQINNSKFDIEFRDLKNDEWVFEKSV